MAKHLCSFCKVNLAQWVYMPSGEDRYWCDHCISSPEDDGCSCNWRYLDINAYHPPLDNPEYPEGVEGVDWKWVNGQESAGAWQSIDKKGRPYPCCEFDFEEEGFDIQKKIFLNSNQKQIVNSFETNEKYFISCKIHFSTGEIIEDYIIEQSYFYILEELELTTNDITKIEFIN